MKGKKVLIGLALVLTMGLGVTTYAATTDSSAFNHKRAGFGMVTGMRGFDTVETVLNNFGITDEEIVAGRNSGKTMYDLVKEKGITEDQFKTAMLDEKNKAIDKAIAEGKITSEEGVQIKENLKNNIDNCTGIPGQRMGKNNDGNGKGRIANGGNRGLCSINSTAK